MGSSSGRHFMLHVCIAVHGAKIIKKIQGNFAKGLCRRYTISFKSRQKMALLWNHLCRNVCTNEVLKGRILINVSLTARHSLDIFILCLFNNDFNHVPSLEKTHPIQWPSLFRVRTHSIFSAHSIQRWFHQPLLIMSHGMNSQRT